MDIRNIDETNSAVAFAIDHRPPHNQLEPAEGQYDIVAVFQVVRRDETDGGLILAWRIIRDFDKPVLSRD